MTPLREDAVLQSIEKNPKDCSVRARACLCVFSCPLVGLLFSSHGRFIVQSYTIIFVGAFVLPPSMFCILLLKLDCSEHFGLY